MFKRNIKLAASKKLLLFILSQIKECTLQKPVVHILYVLIWLRSGNFMDL